MGVTLKFYQVHLNYFNQAIGSKNQTLVDEALLYIEKTRLSSLNKRELSEELALYNSYLHSLVFDTINPLKNSPKTKKPARRNVTNPSMDEKKREWIAAYSILAILAQDPSFYSRGMSGWGIFLDLFEDLSTNFKPSANQLKFWNYLLNGRVLNDEITYECSYTYLTNTELEEVLQSLQVYQDEKGKQHLQFLEQEHLLASKRLLEIKQEAQHYAQLWQKQREELSKGNIGFFETEEGQQLSLVSQLQTKMELYPKVIYALEILQGLFGQCLEEGYDFFGIVSY